MNKPKAKYSRPLQGMTYDKMACSLQTCFAPGQAYVALSRCSSLNGLYLTDQISPKNIITDNEIKNFYNKLKQRN